MGSKTVNVSIGIEENESETVIESSKCVVFVARDVSGSMGSGPKEDIIERTLLPLETYFEGRYRETEFVNIAYDAEAWRTDSFSEQTTGGTRISSIYDVIEPSMEDYSDDWDAYVVIMTDGENSTSDIEDTTDKIRSSGLPTVFIDVGEYFDDRNRMQSQHLEDNLDDSIHVERIEDVDEVYSSVNNIISHFKH